MTGKTPNEYLEDVRLKKAQILLRQTTLPVGRIALEVGFNEAGYFSKIFKMKTGIRPGGFR